MSAIQAIVYGAVQGLTEFLPVSSSAHLVLVPVFTGWSDPGLAFNVALHWGTLIAVTAYFRKDIGRLVQNALGSFTGEKTPDKLLPWKIALATLPAAIIGFLLEHQAETVFRSPWVIVFTLSILGVALFAAERAGRQDTALESISWTTALIIGVSQGMAIIPGVSRSGVTITAGLLLGLEKTAAVRYSFLLSIPIIMGAGLLEAGFIFKNAGDPMLWLAMGSSAAAGWAAIHFLLTYVRTRTFTPFAVYRLGLAAVLAVWLLRR